jgi:hypothetical protein
VVLEQVGVVDMVVRLVIRDSLGIAKVLLSRRLSMRIEEISWRRIKGI